MAKFCPLFSSSKGNSIYIGGGNDNILIDCGMCLKRTEDALKRIDVAPDTVKNIFITHEHSDHIKGIKVFTKKYPTNLIMTKGTRKALEEKQLLDNAESVTIIDEKGVDVGCMHIDFFRTSHDANESCGYTVTMANGRKIAVATDLGIMTDEVMNSIKGSDLVMIESNHDVNMLQCGSYPYILKRRILGIKGHLSNDACGLALRELLESGTTRFFLGHLSEENNIPQLAYQTGVASLSSIGAKENDDYFMRVAKPCWDERCMVL